MWRSMGTIGVERPDLGAPSRWWRASLEDTVLTRATRASARCGLAKSTECAAGSPQKPARWRSGPAHPARTDWVGRRRLAKLPMGAVRMDMDILNIDGSCHCGTVRFRVRLRNGLHTARRCTCSYCRMRGAIAVSAD